jgi:hypothetical protein
MKSGRNLMSNNNKKQFEINVVWVISVFQGKDLLTMNVFKERAKKLIETIPLKDVFLTAMNYLAESDSETFYWALQHIDSDIYIEIKQDISLIVAQNLIKQGCIPGKDFSAARTGYLIINQKAADTLINNPSIFIYSSLLLQEVIVLLK